MTDDRPSKARPRSRDPTRTPAAPGTFPVVAIGASAGGLDACRKFLDSLPAHLGMAYILVQHLDPTHKSLMAELLAQHTAMKVVEATEGCQLDPNRIYVIPPGRYLSVRAGTIHLSPPLAHHGARLPFDFLLTSLARTCGRQTVCIVLSGAGGDGSAGLAALKAAGGATLPREWRERPARRGRTLGAVRADGRGPGSGGKKQQRRE